ncbi:MAG: hydroxymethylbilane synthase [Pseudomonadota bacterium]
MKTLRIATRQSPLALWQAEHVKQQLQSNHDGLKIELVGMTTAGDRFLEAPLVEAGGKGLFIKELEQAIQAEQADIAVHSMKDVTIDMPEGFILPVIMKREVVQDVLISNEYQTIDDIPQGGVVGTSSLRRQSQLKAFRPDITIRDLRGNVGTRLGKLDNGEYDAIILAAAGVIRLGLSDRISQYIPDELILPAIGQGAVGIECLEDADNVLDLINVLNDEQTSLCVTAERAMSRCLYGGCQLPIAGQATLDNGTITLHGLVAKTDGSEIIKSSISGTQTDADALGHELGERLLANGADKILKELLKH